MKVRTKLDCRDIVLALLSTKSCTRPELRAVGQLDQREVGRALEALQRAGAIRAIKPLGGGPAHYEVIGKRASQHKGANDRFDDARFDALLAVWGIAHAGPSLQLITPVSRVVRLCKIDDAVVDVPRFCASDEQ